MRVGVIAMPLPWPKPTTSPSTIATVTTRTTLRDTALMSSAARAGMATERLARTRASSAIRRVMGAQLRGARFERKHRDARDGGAWQQGGRTTERECVLTTTVNGLS